MGKHTLDVLSQSPAPIVVPSGSCGDMLFHHYPELFANDPVYGPKAQAVAERTYEFAQFLTEVMGVHVIPVKAAPGSHVTYHPSCHLLRGLGVTKAPRQLLAGVENLTVDELNGAEECCGFGGLFAIKMADISSAMLERKLDHIVETGAPVVVGCDVSCLLHIGGGLHRRGAAVETRHLAELLAQETK
jgi:L-lactate dehydrogenase complex protein LldE